MLPMFNADPVYLTAMLLLLVVIAEWLSRQKLFHRLGSSLIVIIAAALLANFGVIPSAHDAPPLYEAVFTYIAPLAIFFLLLDVRLKDVKLAGAPMLTMFAIGAASTVIATLCSYWVLKPQHHIPDAFAVAGMFTGTYIGGSANLNAVALQYGVFKNGNLFAAINAVDNIITAIWIVVTLLIPSFLQKWLPRVAVDAGVAQTPKVTVDDSNESITVTGLALLLALGAGTLFLSTYVNKLVPKLPMILVLTTIALLLAQFKPLQRIKGGNIIGFLFVMVFLAVVGAYCDVQALIANRQMALLLMVWVTFIVVLHGVLIFVTAGLLKQDWYLTAIASNANIGGATTAAALATSFNRSHLRLPGILVGSVGTVIGTYLGVFIAELLR